MELFDTHCHFETNDRDEIAAILRRAHAAGVTRLITQNGHAASYLVDCESMDALFDQIDLSRDIEISRREFAEGKGIPQEQVERETRAMLNRWSAEDRGKAAP